MSAKLGIAILSKGTSYILNLSSKLSLPFRRRVCEDELKRSRWHRWNFKISGCFDEKGPVDPKCIKQRINDVSVELLKCFEGVFTFR